MDVAQSCHDTFTGVTDAVRMSNVGHALLDEFPTSMNAGGVINKCKALSDPDGVRLMARDSVHSLLG